MKEIMVWSAGNAAQQSKVAAWLAEAAGKMVLADYDLGSAELSRMWGQGECQKQEINGNRAWIDVRKCIHCGTCEIRCTFKAIHNLVVDQTICESCGLCASLCAVVAISMRRGITVGWEVCQKPAGVLVKAPANENADIATSLIKWQSAESAGKLKAEIIISSGPSVLDETLLTTMVGVDLVLLVVDPSKTEMPELERVVSICTQFRIPTLVCLTGEESKSVKKIEEFCSEYEIEIIGRLLLKDKPETEIISLWKELKKRF